MKTVDTSKAPKLPFCANKLAYTQRLWWASLAAERTAHFNFECYHAFDKNKIPIFTYNGIKHPFHLTS
jgi:hypothetical protein